MAQPRRNPWEAINRERAERRAERARNSAIDPVLNSMFGAMLDKAVDNAVPTIEALNAHAPPAITGPTPMDIANEERVEEESMPRQTIRCIVACLNSTGAPDFFACTVDCSSRQYANGDHYDIAEELAHIDNYEDPMVIYDENDGPAWLFERFNEIVAGQTAFTTPVDQASDDVCPES